ncbi:MAG: DeoR/GlpR transcriptional regulator [Lachnospiraceae bacterium]|nr:DeoR/GlpR transcriptional regulator [Lachnospiraceae bacterium]
MLMEERLAQIVREVENKQSVTVQELMQILQISESTIRRDLTTLHARGQIIKVHGGAIAVENAYYTRESSVHDRKELNKEEKIRIGRYAASLIHSEDFVFLDAGTTTSHIIDFLEDKHAKFVTNGIENTQRLAAKGLQVYILGGEYKANTEAVVGNEAMQTLERFNFTKGFWGANGISMVNGFSTPEIREGAIKTKAMERTRDCFIVGDSTKFDQISSVSFADFEAASIITTKVKLEKYQECTNILEVDLL